MKYESALMTHVDGGMHHLGVKAEHIAKQVILVPDPMMVSYYAKFMDNAQMMGDYREYVTYTGIFEGKPLTVMSCGFGCMPMAIAVEELKHIGCTTMIKISDNAAIQPDIEVGTICAASGAVRSEGASKEYIDVSYPAISDMELLSNIIDEQPDIRISLFRSHDVENLDSPYGPDGPQRIRKWTDLGVDVFDGETSSMFIVGACLRSRAASLSLISENYVTGKKLPKEQLDTLHEKMFRIAARALLK